jgi:small-conductance mechanosensitive channel
MMIIENWSDVFTRSLQGLWYGVISFIPDLVIALVIFAIGWILAALVEKLVEAIIGALKVDSALKSAGFEDVMKRAGHNLNSGRFLGALVRWFVIVVFLMASFDVLGLSQVNGFLKDVVTYIPQVIIAVLILMVAVVVANALQKIVVASAKAGHVKSAEMMGRVTRWAIWIFAVITALFNLGVAPGLIQSIITAVVAGGALALGLAFGLGGKDAAQRWLEKTTSHLFERE